MAQDGEADPGSITYLLGRVGTDLDARERLFGALYNELHLRASGLMYRQPADHTLQATALVGEVFLKLFGHGDAHWDDRRHFLLTASRAMRQVLVDHSRMKQAAKRSAERAETALDALVLSYEDRSLDLEALDRALEQLKEFDPEMMHAVEIRFFGGASMEETARVLNLPKRTFQRRWKATRAWLLRFVS